MGRNNEDFESGQGITEEEHVDRFNETYETWKKAGNPFYKKEKEDKND